VNISFSNSRDFTSPNEGVETILQRLSRLGAVCNVEEYGGKKLKFCGTTKPEK